MSVSLTELKRMRKTVQLKQRQEELRKNFGLLFYKPHRKQAMFHAAAKYKRRYMRTGNRFGKSDMGAGEDCAFALGERVWLPKGDPLRTLGIPQRPTKGLICVQDWDKAEEIFTCQDDGLGLGKLFRFLPKDKIGKIRKSSNGKIAQLQVESVYGGWSSIYFDTVRSFLQDGMGAESSNWDYIHVDEPIPEKMWKAHARGLVDVNGSAWFTCTPLRYQWINRMFVPSGPQQLDEDGENVFDHDGSQRWMMVGSMHDNPYISEEGKREYISELNEAEVMCRVQGKPLYQSGLVWGAFDWNKHVFAEKPHGWEAINKPPKNYTVRASIDPHPKTPHAVLFVATSPTGESFVFDELFVPDTIKDLAKRIKARLDGYYWPSIPCDWVAFEESPVTKRAWADEMFDAGLRVHKASRARGYAIDKGREIFQEEFGPESGIKISAQCSRFIGELEEWAFDPDTEKPIDENDHLCEAFGRLLIEGKGLVYMEQPEVFEVSPPDEQTVNLNLDEIALYEEVVDDTDWLQNAKLMNP